MSFCKEVSRELKMKVKAWTNSFLFDLLLWKLEQSAKSHKTWWIIWNLECKVQKSHMFVCNQKPLPGLWKRLPLYIQVPYLLVTIMNDGKWREVVRQTCLSRLTFIIANLFFLRPIDMSKKWGTNFGDFWTSSNFMYWGMAKCGASFGWCRKKVRLLQLSVKGGILPEWQLCLCKC
jgi:hypothetical protein